MVAAYAALTCGYAFSILLSSMDSSLMSISLTNAHVIDANYTMSTFSFVFIYTLIIIVASILITKITEDVMVKKLPKYEFDEGSVEDEIISKREFRGLLFAALVCILYIIIVIYNIIPGLPFSGNLLDYSQTLYIDKLFSYESFFTNGFVFIVTMLFVLAGLSYGIGARTIKNNKDLADNLGYSLNGIGKVLVLVFLASTFISIFKHTNIGPTIVAALTNLIGSSNFGGISLVLLLFISSVISTIFVPSSLAKWAIMANTAVPAFMNSGMSPAFAQAVFRMGESVALCITPMLAYFVIYLAYIEQYNQTDKPIRLFKVIKWQLPYLLMMLCICLIVIIVFYVVNIPLGIGGMVAL
jgi:aminobenzoyl-glutamate transport protein